MNEFAIVSMGAYFGTTTAAKRAHLGVSMGLFDPAVFPSVTIVRSLSILAGFNATILGG